MSWRRIAPSKRGKRRARRCLSRESRERSEAIRRRMAPDCFVAAFLATRSRAIEALAALQLLVAFAVIAVALLDPFQAAVRIGGLVGVILGEAGMEALFGRRFARILRRNSAREDHGAGRLRGRGFGRRSLLLFLF